jgi:hypothetical protein
MEGVPKEWLITNQNLHGVILGMVAKRYRSKKEETHSI